MRPGAATAWTLAAACLSLAALAGCDALLVSPAPAAPDLSVSFALAGASADGTAAAFAKADRVWLRFIRADSATRDTIIRTRPRGATVRVRLALDTRERVKGLGVQAELRLGGRALFAGHAIVAVEPGKPVSATIPIAPVAAALRVDRDVPTFEALGDTIRLASAVLFATGDTIPGVAASWSSEADSIVQVTRAGLAIARGDGRTRLLARYGPLADSVAVRVARVPAEVVVLPAVSRLGVGEVEQLKAGALDHNRFPIPGVAITWTTSDAAIATVDQTGRVRGVGPGLAKITAAAGSLSATARVRVEKR